MGKSKQHFTRNLISMILCLALVLSMVPAVLATEAESGLFDLNGSSMTLGNTLEINFAIDTAYLEADGNYAVISKEYADARGTVTKTVPQSQWKPHSGTVEYFSYAVSAKEMNDKLTVTVYNAGGEQLSTPYEDSVAGYCLRMLGKEEEKAAPNKQIMSLLVDMLNYGAAAQAEWSYNTDALANAGLSETQKGYATVPSEANSCLEKGTGYYGTSLSLKENLLMNFAYYADQIQDAAYAEVTFIDHYGNDESETIQAKDFKTYDAQVKYIEITSMAVADCRKSVTVTLYDAEGNALSTTVDSAESYISRMSGDIYDAILAFSDGAHNYFHSEDADPGLEDSTAVLSTNVSVADGKVSEDAAIGEEGITAKIPAGVQVEENTTTLTLTITEKTSSDSGVELEDGQQILPLDIHIDGVSEENATPITVFLGQILPSSMNIGNVTLYHVEDGVSNAMIQVMTLAELDAHNEFYYDPVTGDVTVSIATFSEIALLSEAAKWEGSTDHNWYDANATELTIANADQLWSFSQIVGGMAEGIEQDDFSGKTVKLIADIDLNDTDDENGRAFYPIGYYNNLKSYAKVSGGSVSSNVSSFEGIFDGNGHTVKNFNQNTWEMFGDYNSGYAGTPNHYKDAMGLFGYVYGGTVKNLTIDNFTSTGEFTPTGCVAAYACNATFENISIINCNPGVYNTGNGGIVGIGGNNSDTDDYKLTFNNITVDNTNKITALWGSWDVACGGLVGMFRGDGHVYMNNCHVAAQIDAYNDVCGNYQYYWYRYSGMLIGTNDNMYTAENGRVYPETDKFHAEDCTVHFGEWNDYYYCELVANSIASYTHDHQFSRLTEVDRVDVAAMTVTVGGNTTAIPTSGHCNYVVVEEGKEGTEFATCYHFVNGEVWNHEDAGKETVDVDGDGVKEEVLKEDRQHYYLPFNQLVTGYGWGVNHIPLYDDGNGCAFGDVTILGRDFADSVPKFEAVIEDETPYLNGTEVKLSDLFQELAAPAVKVLDSKVQVFVSPATEDGDARCIYHPSTTGNWGDGTVTLLGEGYATVTISDYFFCEPFTVTVELTPHECEFCKEHNAIPWTEEAYTGASSTAIEAGASSVHSGYYYLANDTELESAIDLRSKDAQVTICLNGKQLIGKEVNTIYSRIFRIDHGASATIVDGKKSGTIVPRGHDITMGSVAYVADSGSSLSISDCTIDGINSSILNNDPNGGHRGGAIRMDANKDDATVRLNNVTIKNFTTKPYTYTAKDDDGNVIRDENGKAVEKIGYGWGGALSVARGKVYIDGCIIEDCTSAYGAAAIHLSGGEMTISNTTIRDCISGGEIEYTYAGAIDGQHYYTGTGTIFVESKGVLNIKEGTEITNNTSYQEGAAIIIEDYTESENLVPVVNMYGGKIYGNACKNANASCGGVKVNGEFNMYGGEIYNNKSGTTETCHEILIYEKGIATIIDGTVTRDTTDGKVGNTVNVYRGTSYIKGGQLHGNVNCGFPYYDEDDPSVLISTPTLVISGGTFWNDVVSSANLTTGEVGSVTITDGQFMGLVRYSASAAAPVTDFERMNISGGFFTINAVQYLPGYLWDADTNTVSKCTDHNFGENNEEEKCTCGSPNPDYEAPVTEPTEPEATEPETTEPEVTEPEVTEPSSSDGSEGGEGESEAEPTV